MKPQLEAAIDFYNERHVNKPITKAELAAKAGISRQHLHKIIKGKSAPDVYTAIKIARALGKSRVEVLFAPALD